MPIMPTSQPAPPMPPTPPSIGPEGSPAIAGSQVATTGRLVATSREGLQALKNRRDELRNQMDAASSRRSELVKELNNTSSVVVRNGIEQRIQLLDQRVLRIERDIDLNGQSIAAGPMDIIASQSTAPRYGPFSSGQLTAISIVSIVLVWAPLALAAARVMMRRWAVPRPAPQILESAARLERMEQAVDAVAIEVERISEGQRFVTQLMSKQASALGVGQAAAEPIRIGDAATVVR